MLSLVACRKNNQPANNALSGNWRMVSVKEISSGQINLKPIGTNGDVDISLTFYSATQGNLLGNTPSNALNGTFTISANNAINLSAVSATKVAETVWGNYFYSNTLTIERYGFTAAGLLELYTNNYILQFENR